MKNVFSLSTVFVAAFAVAIAGQVVIKGKTNTPLGVYTVEKSPDPVMIGDQELETYIISYENSEKQVKVAIDKEKKCKKYLVCCEDMSIQYICNNEYFGIEKLDRKYTKEGYQTDIHRINQGAFYHQRIITREDKTDRNCLGLIAVYYPQLIRNYELVFTTP